MHNNRKNDRQPFALANKSEGIHHRILHAKGTSVVSHATMFVKYLHGIWYFGCCYSPQDTKNCKGEENAGRLPPHAKRTAAGTRTSTDIMCD
jgi:hypothetical protein